jgi:hypothetical protein
MNPAELSLAGKLVQYGLPAVLSAYGAGSKAANEGQNPLQVGTAALLGGGLGLGLGVGGRSLGRMAGSKLFGQGAANIAGVVGSNVLPLAAPALASGVTGLAGSTANTTTGAAATVLQQQQMKIQELQDKLNQTSALSNYSAGLDNPMTMQEQLTGTPAVARTGEVLERGLQRNQNVQDWLAYRPLVSQAQKDEMDRNMAAAQIRQNIATNAALLQGGVRTAQQIGINSAQQLGGAMSAQYQYQ